MSKRGTATSLIFFLVLSLWARNFAFAQRVEDKITICHRTDSVTNPYNVLSVDPDAADGNTGNDNGRGDHSEHTGPVATSQAMAQALKDAKQEWGDIIPPHDNYGGLNWTPDGQAIYRNGCSYVTTTTTPTMTPTTTGTPSPTATPTQTPSPTNGPSATPTPTTPEGEPTQTPTPTSAQNPTETPTQGPSATPAFSNSGGVISTGGGAMLGAATSTAPKPLRGQVLGVSTLAATGTFAQAAANSALILGLALLSYSGFTYALTQKKDR